MKTLSFFVLNSVLIFSCFSQAEVKVDTLNVQNTSESELLLSMQPKNDIAIKFSCLKSSISENNPLFVIDGIVMTSDDNSNYLNQISPEDVVSVTVLKGPFPFTCFSSLADNGIVLIVTKNGLKELVEVEKELPFKIHKICNDNWVQTQDLYTAIQANVPECINKGCLLE